MDNRSLDVHQVGYQASVLLLNLLSSFLPLAEVQRALARIPTGGVLVTKLGRVASFVETRG